MHKVAEIQSLPIELRVLASDEANHHFKQAHFPQFELEFAFHQGVRLHNQIGVGRSYFLDFIVFFFHLN